MLLCYNKCPSGWFDSTLTAMKKLKIAYNYDLRRLLNLPKYNSASEMIVKLNIPSFGEFLHHVFYADGLCLMALCAIALQELINVCYQYSKEIDLNFNATKSFCVAFTPKHYILVLPSLFMNSLPILYADSIKYLGFIFTSNNCDDSDTLKQMRMLYCRSNRLVRLYNKCSNQYCLNYVGVSAQYFTVLISGHNKKTTFSKIRVAYNNVYRKILGVSRPASASGIFVSNDIPNFEAFLRKSIYSFTTRLSSSSNKLIGAIEQSWIMKSLVWKTWEKKCTFKSTVMSFSVFLVFILPYFICSYFYFM